MTQDLTWTAATDAYAQTITVTSQTTIEPRHAYACSPDMAFNAVLHTVQPAYGELVTTSNALYPDVKRPVSVMQVQYSLQQGGTSTAQPSTRVTGTRSKNATLYARCGCTSAMLPRFRMRAQVSDPTASCSFNGVHVRSQVVRRSLTVSILYSGLELQRRPTSSRQLTLTLLKLLRSI
jgi:hypothetical protein